MKIIVVFQSCSEQIPMSSMNLLNVSFKVKYASTHIQNVEPVGGFICFI